LHATQRARVLVIDDDPGIRTLIAALLRRRGYEHDLVENGDEAVHRLRRACYDAILLDLMLPAQNGFEILRYVRAERPHALGKVIVLTAASNTTLRDFDARGICALIRKPFDIDELLMTVDAAVNRRATPEPSSAGSAPSTSPATSH